jgi:bifunctional DNA-binding transcriptional regulator/antitoxin component of YhaV-PrlF toxin-antitoxin module
MSVKELERKVSKMGNSLGVTMTESLKSLNINLGDSVKINVRGDEIIIKKIPYVTLPEGISSDFLDVLQNAMDKYDDTLKGLKDR